MERFPWVTYDSFEWLKDNISPDWLVFEWGSGGSTLFFEDNVKSFYSIEHDILWHNKIKNELKNHHNYLLIEPDTTGDNKYRSSKFKKCYFEKYVLSINKFMDNTFDFIFIDGRSRVECTRVAVEKLKTGGFCMLDNSDRKEYKECFYIMEKFNRIDFRGNGKGGIWMTTIWKK